MISIIVPVYGVEDYLTRCVQSVLAQTVSDWELILVDDGSTDRSGEMCDAFCEQDSRISVIHQPNGGLSAARNSGLKRAKGEWIAFLDSDDCLHPQMLARLLDAAQSKGCEIASCRYLPFSDRLPSAEGDGAVTVYATEDAMRYLIRNTVFQQVVWNKLYSRRALENLLFPVGKYHEDEFFTWQAFLKAERVAAVDFTGYFYFQRQGSIMGTRFSEKRLDVLKAMAERSAQLKVCLPAVYADSCAALLKSGLYQYQCFLRTADSDPDGSCRRTIVRYCKACDTRAALSAAAGKQKLWYRLFLWFPRFTAQLRNRLHIGL